MEDSLRSPELQKKLDAQAVLVNRPSIEMKHDLYSWNQSVLINYIVGLELKIHDQAKRIKHLEQRSEDLMEGG